MMDRLNSRYISGNPNSVQEDSLWQSDQFCYISNSLLLDDATNYHLHSCELYTCIWIPMECSALAHVRLCFTTFIGANVQEIAH